MNFPLVNALLSLFVVSHLRLTEVVAKSIQQVRIVTATLYVRQRRRELSWITLRTYTSVKIMLIVHRIVQTTPF